MESARLRQQQHSESVDSGYLKNAILRSGGQGQKIGCAQWTGLRAPPHDHARTQGPERRQIKFWNEAGIAYYFSHREAIRAERAPLTRRLIEKAAATAGERALDIGCGFGDVTIELARLVGPNGFALGVDLSAPMLEKAEESARAAGLRNIRFENIDAQTHAFQEHAFELLVSQSGVMFFADAVAAFANLRSTLRRDGRIIFASWQWRERSQSIAIPLNVVAQFIDVPPPRPPGTPGQFGFADPDLIRKILDSAGFVEVTVEDMREKLPVGGGLTLDDAAEWFLSVEVPTLLAKADSAIRSEIGRTMRNALRPYQDRIRSSNGVCNMAIRERRLSPPCEPSIMFGAESSLPCSDRPGRTVRGHVRPGR